MIVKTEEKQAKKLKAKFPNLNIIRINENSWEITKSYLTEQEQKEIALALKENTVKYTANTIQAIEKKGVEEMAENEKTNGYEQAKERISAGIALISETVKAEIYPKINELSNSISASIMNVRQQLEEIKSASEQEKNQHIEKLQIICDSLTGQVNSTCEAISAKITEQQRVSDDRLEKIEKNLLEFVSSTETNFQDFKNLKDKLKAALA